MQEFFCGLRNICYHIFIHFAIFCKIIPFRLSHYMYICVYICFSVHTLLKLLYCDEQKWNILNFWEY